MTPPPRAYVPDGLDLSFLPPGRRDSARYLVGRLYVGRHVAGKEPDEFQRLYSGLLQTLLGDDYRRGVINPLLDHGIIEENPAYSAGRNGREGYSKSFRLAEPYRHEHFRSVPLTHPEVVRRLEAARVAQEAGLDAPVYRHLRGWVGRLTVRADYPADVLPLRVLAGGDHRFESCRQGRLHTNLTNLARVHRRHLVLEGVDEPLMAIDIKTSQPLLLGLTVRDKDRIRQDEGFNGYARERAREWEKVWERKEKVREKKVERGEGERMEPSYVGLYSSECLHELERYIGVCLSSDLYQMFVGPTGYTRDRLKKFFMATVYGRPGVAADTKTGVAFRSEFPHLWGVLAAMNAGDNGRLPRFLQTVESWLVIWRTCGRLAREFPQAPLLTIHDCLVTTERYVEPFRRTLVEEFKTVWDVAPQSDTKALAV